MLKYIRLELHNCWGCWPDHTVEACTHTFGFADAGIAVLPLLLLLRGRLYGKVSDPARHSVG